MTRVAMQTVTPRFSIENETVRVRQIVQTVRVGLTGGQGAPGAKGDPGGNVMAIGLFTAAAALSIPVGTDIVRTAGYSASGHGVAEYFADAAVDAAYVAAHPRAAFISSNGRGFRLRPSAGFYYELAQFGAALDNSTDDSAAWLAAKAYIAATPTNVTTFYRGGRALFVDGVAYLATTTVDVEDVSFGIVGGSGGMAGGYRSGFRWAANTTGIRVQRFDTEGTGADPSPDYGGDNSWFTGLVLYGGGGTSGHGFHLRARATLTNCSATGFGLHGCYIGASTTVASSDPLYGNANLWRIDNCLFNGNGHSGVRVEGADANSGIMIGGGCSGNGNFGVWDTSTLGNTYLRVHTATNGSASAGHAGSVGVSAQVSHGGNRYYVAYGQATLASTEEPGTGSAWTLVGAGGVHASYPAWVSGTAYREGGAFRLDNANATSKLLDCYGEGGQPPPYVRAPAWTDGGKWGIGMDPVGTGQYLRSSTTGELEVNSGFVSRWLDGSAIVRSRLGDGSNSFLRFEHATHAPSIWRFKFSGSDVRIDYANSNSQVPFWLTGPNTTNQFGTGAAVPYAFYPPRLQVGDTIANARRITNGTAAPTTGTWARGDVVFNRNAASGQPAGWMCVTAGSPGTWAAMANLA